MSFASDIPLSQLQFYLTADYPCNYLPGRQARSLVADPDFKLNSAAYSRLAQHGFRRSGDYTYRPHCQGCNACVPLRVEASAFQPTRSQRRAWKKHIGLQTTMHLPFFSEEHYALYLRYQRHRHAGGGMDEDDPKAYERFLLHSELDTLLIEFRQDQALRMVSVIDKLQDGVSAVYTFFDPDVAKSSFGVFNVLWQIELCRQLELPYVYLGYWIQDCRKMQYKTDFQPAQGLIDGNWKPINREKI